MPRRLIATGLRNLRSGDRVPEVTDAALPGLAVRFYRSGNKRFICRYRLDGWLRRIVRGPASGMTLAEARAAYERAKARGAQGRDPQEEKQRREREAAHAITFEQPLERLLEDHASKFRRDKQYRRTLNDHFVRRWKKRKAAGVTRREVVVGPRLPTQAHEALSTTGSKRICSTRSR